MAWPPSKSLTLPFFCRRFSRALFFVLVFPPRLFIRGLPLRHSWQSRLSHHLVPLCALGRADRAQGRALVGGLYFRHRLVVTPSAALRSNDPTSAAWLGVGISAFTEFTRFYNVHELNVVGELARPVEQSRGRDLAPIGVRGRHVRASLGPTDANAAGLRVRGKTSPLSSRNAAGRLRPAFGGGSRPSAAALLLAPGRRLARR